MIRYKVFLSHSKEDEKLAIQIKKAIEKKGKEEEAKEEEAKWEVYMFQHDPQPGKELARKLIKAISERDVFVVLIMREKTDSSWVKIETGIAVGKGMEIIPVVQAGLRNNDLPVLRGLEYISIESAQPEEAISRLYGSLRLFKERRAKYSGGGFEETRYIFDPKVPNESMKKKKEYERVLVERYSAETLVEWNGVKYPTSVMIVGPFEEDRVDEKFKMDSNGKSIARYTPPQVIYDWNKNQVFLEFMRNHPMVKRGEELYDEHMPRLVKCKLENNRLSLRFQESTFFDYIMTNLALDVCRESHGRKLRDILELDLKGRLESLDQTECANGFGVGCLVKTDDDKYVLVSRSDRVTGAQLSFAPSAGGIMKLLPDRHTDGRHNNDESPSVFHAAKRQLWEEMHIDYRRVKKIQLLGITRDLERGGYPDGHFFIEVSLDYENVKREFGSAEHRRETEYQFAVAPEKIANYIQDEKSSSALRGCLYLLHKTKLMNGKSDVLNVHPS